MLHSFVSLLCMASRHLQPYMVSVSLSMMIGPSTAILDMLSRWLGYECTPQGIQLFSTAWSSACVGLKQTLHCCLSTVGVIFASSSILWATWMNARPRIWPLLLA